MEGRININGQIGTYDEVVGVSLLDVISQVKKQPQATSFRVYINSEGGVVDTGFEIFAYLRSLGLPITTIGNGLVASVATVIFMAGTTRYVRENTMFMIHLPMGMARGTSDEILAYSKAIKEVENKVVNFYIDNFRMTRETIEPLLKNETWLTNTQLEDLGITTSSAIVVPAVAKIDLPKTKLNKTMSKKETEYKTAFEKITAFLKGLDTTVVAKTLLTAELKELVFPDLGDDDAIAIDSVAKLDGENPPATVLLQDGRTLTFEGDVLKTIVEVTEPVTVPEAELTAIKAELAEMKANLATRETELATAKANLETEKVKAAKSEAIVAKIREIETEFVTPAVARTTTTSVVSPQKVSRFAKATAKK